MQKILKWKWKRWKLTNFAFGEISQLCHVIGERMEITPIISLDLIKCFGYPLFWAFPYLTTKENSFDDLNKNTHFLNKQSLDIT